MNRNDDSAGLAVRDDKYLQEYVERNTGQKDRLCVHGSLLELTEYQLRQEVLNHTIYSV